MPCLAERSLPSSDSDEVADSILGSSVPRTGRMRIRQGRIFLRNCRRGICYHAFRQHPPVCRRRMGMTGPGSFGTVAAPVNTYGFFSAAAFWADRRAFTAACSPAIRARPSTSFASVAQSSWCQRRSSIMRRLGRCPVISASGRGLNEAQTDLHPHPVLTLGKPVPAGHKALEPAEKHSSPASTAGKAP